MTTIKKRITTPKQLSEEMRRHSPLKKILLLKMKMIRMKIILK